MSSSRHPASCRGAYASSRYVECGMRWTRQRRARVSNCGAATSFVLCCERLLLAADERCCCVRQNRVVPAPVAGVKLCEGEVPDRVQPPLPIREATEARRIRLRGERGISRQTIVQGRPGCLGYACGCSSCAFCAICAAQGAMGAGRHPVFPAPSHDGRGTNDHAQLGRATLRACAVVAVSPDGIFPRLPRPPLQARKTAGNKKRQRRTI